MLIAEGRVEAERSNRSLVHSANTWTRRGRRTHSCGCYVEWSDRGRISFGWGRGTLRALPGVLTLRAETPDKDTLRRVEHPSPIASSRSAAAIG